MALQSRNQSSKKNNRASSGSGGQFRAPGADFYDLREQGGSDRGRAQYPGEDLSDERPYRERHRVEVRPQERQPASGSGGSRSAPGLEADLFPYPDTPRRVVRGNAPGERRGTEIPQGSRTGAYAPRSSTQDRTRYGAGNGQRTQMPGGQPRRSARGTYPETLQQPRRSAQGTEPARRQSADLQEWQQPRRSARGTYPETLQQPLRGAQGTEPARRQSADLQEWQQPRRSARGTYPETLQQPRRSAQGTEPARRQSADLQEWQQPRRSARDTYHETLQQPRRGAQGTEPARRQSTGAAGRQTPRPRTGVQEEAQPWERTPYREAIAPPPRGSYADPSFYRAGDIESIEEERPDSAAERRRRREQAQREREKMLRLLWIRIGACSVAAVLILVIVIRIVAGLHRKEQPVPEDAGTVAAETEEKEQTGTSPGEGSAEEEVPEEGETSPPSGQSSGEEEEGDDSSAAEETGMEETGTDETDTEATGTKETGTEASGTKETGTEETGMKEIGSEETGTEETGSAETETEKAGTEEASGSAGPQEKDTEAEAAGTEQAETAPDDAGTAGAAADTAGNDPGAGQVYSGQDDWRLILVNPWHHLPEGYSIDTTTLVNGESVDSRCYQALSDMLEDCRAAGGTPIVCSSYRPHDKQIKLYEDQVASLTAKGMSREEAEKEAGTVVAVPGTSEHELGLAVDICDTYNQRLDASQADTPTQQWLMENCWDYGFILRYPEDKSEVTGIIYEPWHYRYVGMEAAAQIRDQGICLEEYLSQN